MPTDSTVAAITPGYIETLASQRKRVVEIGNEIDHLAKLVAWTREGLEKDIYSGKTFHDIDRLSKLTRMLSDLVDAKVRLQKSNRELVDSMSREEELKAISRYIRAMESEERVDFLHAELVYANEVEYGRVEHPGT
jgi:hypothetical protein